MKIAVCIKQVPAAAAELDSITGNLIRGQDSVLNPFDAYALEVALRIRDSVGGELWALTMGPMGAAAVLRDAIAMGAEKGVLISDRAFAGADTYATAYTLAQAIRQLDGFDVIVCGRQTTDGDTSQVAAQLAAHLDLPFCLDIASIEGTDEGMLRVTQELSGRLQTVELPLPGLIALGREDWIPRMPTVRRKLLSKQTDLLYLELNDLPDQNPEHYGQPGSRTTVIKTWRVKENPKTCVRTLPPGRCAEELLQWLEKLT